MKRVIPEELWDHVRYNGSIYAIPSAQLVKGSEVIYIRKDWLDKLNLSIPVTFEDYKSMIKAFSEEDPDGNGIRDTYGFTMMKDFYHSSPFFGASGVQLNQWTDREGKLVYGNILPEMKEALSYLSRLFKQEKGMSFTSYVLERKMERARMALMNGARVYDAAAMIGYRDVSYFTKMFRKYWGVTPSSVKK